MQRVCISPGVFHANRIIAWQHPSQLGLTCFFGQPPTPGLSFQLRETNQMEREMCQYLEQELNVDLKVRRSPKPSTHT